MRKSKIMGTGMYVPERVVTNDELATMMTTSDEWIQNRTGIKERRYAKDGEGAASMAVHASKEAIEKAGLTNQDIDMIIFATLSPDIFFPGSGCYLQSKMEFDTIPALDIRQQCSGFIYAVSIADQYIKTGMYDNILVIGAENHSSGLEYNDRGRGVTVLFGDGAGAVVMGPASDDEEGLISANLHAEGKYYDKLWNPSPMSERIPRIKKEDFDDGLIYAMMDGQTVFRNAIPRFSEAIEEALDGTGYTVDDLDLFVPHQANLRINQMVAKKMKIPEEKMVTTIDRYANTTAATIPIGLCEAIKDGRLEKDKLVLAAAFGAGFTWGAFLMRWSA